MPYQPQQPNSPEQELKKSQLFDEALPEKLKYQGVLETENGGLKIKRNGVTPMSPYVIKLETELNSATEEKQTKLNTLAAQLLEDSLDFAEDVDFEDDLEVGFDDLVEQLREPEKIISQSRMPEKVESTQWLDQEPARHSLHELPEFSTDDLLEDGATWEPAPVVESKVKIKWQWRSIVPSLRAHQRAFVMFTLLSFALVLPLQAMQGVSQIKNQGSEITDVGKNAIDTFFSGTAALSDEQFSSAEDDFARANKSFREAEDTLKNLNASIAGLSSVLPQTDKTYDSAHGLLVAGQELSKAAELLSQGAGEIESRTSVNIVTKLSILSTYVEEAQPHLEAAELALEKVEVTAVPDEYQSSVVAMKEKVPQITSSMEEFITLSDTLTTILGDNRTMRYLVAFQNNTELRPTGGFVGSFAQLDLLNGEIDQIYIPEGGTYDLQGQLSEFVASPHPLSLLNARWEFHDANYFPDFPTSAQKMIWFYENSGGPTVDGVIAINATFMPELLAIVGPVEMPEYGITVDSENFLFETQKIVEMDYQKFSVNDEERTVEAPKQFIGDLAPKILERLEDADAATMLAVLDLVGTGLAQKDVQLYFENNALESTIEDLGWSGSIKQTAGDYLMVVNTNLGGGKTDTVIDQDIYLDTVVQDDGYIVNTVTITKEHHGLKSSLFEGDNNVDYLRLYVPKGSELLSANGFEIPADNLFETSDLPLQFDEDLALLVTDVRKDPASKTDIWQEDGKTVFGNWMQTAPGEIETVTFTYRLPFKLTETKTEQTLFEAARERLGFKDLESYSLLIQKQSGVKTRETHVTLSLPSSKSVIWSSHNTQETTVNNDFDQLIQYVIEAK